MDVEAQVTKGSVLVVDADPAVRGLLLANLRSAGWEVLVAASGQAAVEVLRTRPVCAAVFDLRLPDISGPVLLEQTRLHCPGLPVLVTAMEPTVEMAVEAMRAGACDVLVKPISAGKIAKRLEALLPGGTGGPLQFGRCISREPTVVAALRQAQQLVGARMPVMICGTPGTGRKTLATSIQQAAAKERPIISIDCTILSPDRVRQALNGWADASKPAGAIIADVQCLKPGEQDLLAGLIAPFIEAGASIVVTLSDRPDRLAEKGQLSRALAKVLAGGVLHLPPLAARRVDLPLLVEQMLAEMVPPGNRTVAGLTMEALVRYDWPGNVRQLRLVLERASRLAGGGPIEPRHLPILQAVKRDVTSTGWLYGSSINLQEIVEEVERHLIAMALGQTHQNQVKAAELLGVPRTTLRDKLLKYRLIGNDGRQT